MHCRSCYGAKFQDSALRPGALPPSLCVYISPTSTVANPVAEAGAPIQQALLPTGNSRPSHTILQVCGAGGLTPGNGRGTQAGQ
jgi:hypothetical protein